VSKEIIELPSQFRPLLIFEGWSCPTTENGRLALYPLAMAGIYAGVGLALKRRQFRKPLPV
jgi:hypothetical protein